MNRVALAAELEELKLQQLLQGSRWPLVCDLAFRSLFDSWRIDGSRIIAVETLEDSVPLGDWPDPSVVCTEKPEGPTQQRLKDLGLQSMGLFSQLIPRLAAGLPPRFAPRPNGDARLDFVILCSGRCGSTLLARELHEAGVGNAVEHLRPPVRELLLHRDVSRFDFTRWWDLVRTGHRTEGVFGTKVIYGFWEFAEEFLTNQEREGFLTFLDQSVILHIGRRDQIAQAVSDYVATKTGVWHLWKGVAKDDYTDGAARLEDDIPEMLSIYDRYSRHEQAIKTLLCTSDAHVIEIDYDQLVADTKGTVTRIIEEMGLPVADDYATAPLALEPTKTQAHHDLGRKLIAALRRRWLTNDV